MTILPGRWIYFLWGHQLERLRLDLEYITTFGTCTTSLVYWSQVSTIKRFESTRRGCIAGRSSRYENRLKFEIGYQYLHQYSCIVSGKAVSRYLMSIGLRDSTILIDWPVWKRKLLETAFGLFASAISEEEARLGNPWFWPLHPTLLSMPMITMLSWSHKDMSTIFLLFQVTPSTFTSTRPTIQSIIQRQWAPSISQLQESASHHWTRSKCTLTMPVVVRP